MLADAREKTECRNPDPGKAATRIPTWKYRAVRKAILAVTPGRPPGVAFRSLPGLVERALTPRERHDLGSVNWYTTVVKLHMEVLGELERLPGAGPQHLRRTSRRR